jgi:hypothetical protein
MFLLSEMSLDVAADRRRELMAQAEQHRLLRAARRTHRADPPAVRSPDTAGTLGGCGLNGAPAR